MPHARLASEIGDYSTAESRSVALVVGDEKALDAALDRLGDLGVTDFDAAIVEVEEGAEARTLDYLQSRL